MWRDLEEPESEKSPDYTFNTGDIVLYGSDKAVVVRNDGNEVLCPCPHTIIICVLKTATVYKTNSDKITLFE